MTMDSTKPFTPESTRPAMESACRAAGLDPTGTELARMGENAMYRLANAPVMVRIGRSHEAARKEVGIARWLASHEFPAVRLANGWEQPIMAEDLPVTFWQFLEQSPEPVQSGDLGRMLRRLHELPQPTEVELPRFTPMPKVHSRLERVPSGYLSDDEMAFLRERHAQLEEEFQSLSFELPTGAIHADAHTANLMRMPDGTVTLIDFEDFCWGPHEWDACVQAVRYQAFGWLTQSEYEDYVSEYGFDPLQWSGFPVIRAMRELNMTTWLMQQLGHSEQINTEVKKRIADLRDNQAPRHWSAF